MYIINDADFLFGLLSFILHILLNRWNNQTDFKSVSTKPPHHLSLPNPWMTYLCAGLSCAIGAHKLHKLFKRVLVVVIAYGGVGEVWAGLLDDRGRGEVQS